jgi:hypothetical protein
MQVDGSENKEKSEKEQLDDKFYDLDDEFIDDGDLMGEEVLLEPDVFLAESDLMQSEQGSLTNRQNENMINANTEEKQEIEYQQMLRREKRECDRIKDKFTVMSSE